MKHVILLIIAALLAGCVSAPAAPVASSYTIVYEVTGTSTGGANITMQNASGATEQKRIDLPWSLSFTARAGQFVYLSAQKQSEFGAITCRILLDGKEAQKA